MPKVIDTGGFIPDPRSVLIRTCNNSDPFCFSSTPYFSFQYQSYIFSMWLLPPANEVWGKVIFLHLCVILFTGGGGLPPGGSLPPGGVCIQGGLHPGGGSASGGSVCRGVCIWEESASRGGWADPPIGYCGIRSTSGRYASYWNAFLLTNLDTCFTGAKNNRGCEHLKMFEQYRQCIGLQMTVRPILAQHWSVVVVHMYLLTRLSNNSYWHFHCL